MAAARAALPLVDREVEPSPEPGMNKQLPGLRQERTRSLMAPWRSPFHFLPAASLLGSSTRLGRTLRILSYGNLTEHRVEIKQKRITRSRWGPRAGELLSLG